MTFLFYRATIFHKLKFTEEMAALVFCQTNIMKHAEASYKTKCAMTASLKKIMETKPLSKITISEICNDCGINRKTFYYHFQDVLDLLRWMLDEEALDVIKKADLLNDYEAVLHFIIDYVDKNKHLLICAYDALGREGMKRFLTSDLRYVAGLLISEVENKLGKFVDSHFRDFLCDFYTNALTGILIDWFHNRPSLDRKEIMDYLILTIKASLPSVIEERAKFRL